MFKMSAPNKETLDEFTYIVILQIVTETTCPHERQRLSNRYLEEFVVINNSFHQVSDLVGFVLGLVLSRH